MATMPETAMGENLNNDCTKESLANTQSCAAESYCANINVADKTTRFGTLRSGSATLRSTQKSSASGRNGALSYH